MYARVSIKRCETCGSSLELEAPSGFCPACLLTTALNIHDEDADVAAASIADYEILSEIGRGGMGIIYRARQRRPDRIVALKMILPSHIGSADALTRFRGETEAAASLDHECILPIYAVGEQDGAPFYSMKFAEGGSLAARLSDFKDKPRASALLVTKLALAVAHAHERGILHRDLKPGNVLFDGAGKPFVSDFGLAKWLEHEADLTQTLAILGTPYYMAPEQAGGGQTLTSAADVYSLGAILYQLLTGQPPFRGDNPMEVLRQAAERLPQRPRALHREIPRDLETICLKCLEKNPSARYTSAGALADDLERFVTGRPIRARRAGPAKHFLRWTKRNPAGAGLAAASACLLVSLAFVAHHGGANAGDAQPSVAVLPFESSDADNASALFANGIHDNVLVDLSKLAALKVISRDSVMQYRGAARDLPEIGNALGVSAVLEGNVHREGEHSRVNVQLIRAADGAQIWAENYERELSDAFAGEIALQIASALKAKVSGAEAITLHNAPTKNGEAYRRFVEARSLYTDYLKLQPDLDKAERLYGEAIALDPNFALAYAHLAQLENVYFEMYDQSPARREKSRAAARRALQLQLDLPEGHVALGQDYWRANVNTGEIDYAKALREFALAQRGLPNDAEVYESIGRIQRHQGKWAESTANLKKAVSLDPNSIERWHRLFFNYELTRNYDAAAQALEHAITLAPVQDRWTYLAHRAYLHLLWKGDLSELERVLQPSTQNPKRPHPEQVIEFNIFLRRYADAEKAALDDTREVFPYGTMTGPPKSLVLGRIYSYMRDEAKARAAYESARLILEPLVQAHPRDSDKGMFLAETYARLGRKEQAIREARRAAEIIPESKDAWLGASLQRDLASICVMVGQLDQALPIIEHVLDVPSFFFINQLRLDPLWEPVRQDSRYQQILTRGEKTIRVE